MTAHPEHTCSGRMTNGVPFLSAAPRNEPAKTRMLATASNVPAGTPRSRLAGVPVRLRLCPPAAASERKRSCREIPLSPANTEVTRFWGVWPDRDRQTLGPYLE